MMRLEQEGVATQGPHSEFMLNLGVPPESFSAEGIFGGTVAGGGDANMDMTVFGSARTGAGSVGVGGGDGDGQGGDLVWGVVLGFLLGPIMVFFLCGPTLPRKQKVGILLGISANLMAVRFRGSGGGGADGAADDDGPGGG